MANLKYKYMLDVEIQLSKEIENMGFEPGSLEFNELYERFHHLINAGFSLGYEEGYSDGNENWELHDCHHSGGKPSSSRR